MKAPLVQSYEIHPQSRPNGRKQNIGISPSHLQTSLSNNNQRAQLDTEKEGA